MLIWLIVLLYPAPLLMVATLMHKRVSLFIMLITQALLLTGPLIRLLIGQAPFSGDENSLLALIAWVFIGLLIGWPIAERLRRTVDRRRETITSTIILPQAFHSGLFATIITTLLAATSIGLADLSHTDWQLVGSTADAGHFSDMPDRWTDWSTKISTRRALSALRSRKISPSLIPPF
jgi:hypothetical protein